MSIKFDVAKYDGQSDFSIWKIKMKALLRREGSVRALDNSYADGTPQATKDDAEEKAISAILLSLSDKVIRKVQDETTTKACGTNSSSCTPGNLLQRGCI